MGKQQQVEPLWRRELPRGVQIRKHAKSESIQIFFTYRGVHCRETLGGPVTKQKIKYAERLRGEILNDIERRTFRYADYFPNSKRAGQFGEVVSQQTVGDLLSTQLAVWKKNLQPSTYRGYKYAVSGHLIPNFGHIRLRDLTPNMIRDWLKGLDLSAKRIRNVLTPLRCVLDDAVNDDLIARNPMDRIVLDKLLSTQSREKTSDVDPFSPDEIDAILGACDGEMRNLFQFAFFTGLRTSELIALEWADIDWGKREVRVSRAVVERQVKGPKTRAGVRSVLLLPLALEALRDQKRFTYLAGGRMFQNPRTDCPWQTDGQIRRTAWIPTLRRAGVRYRKPYQTRHTYASMLISRDENQWWIARQMGHESIEMLVRHYGKWMPDNRVQGGCEFASDWSSSWFRSATEREHASDAGAIS